MAGRPWSVSEQKQALAWRQGGVATTEIARRIGRSRAAVKHFLVGAGAGYADGEAGRPWSAQDEEQVIELRSQGLSRADIARRTGRTKAAISHQLKRLTVSYPCRSCHQLKPADAFGWHASAGLPACRDCRRTQGNRRRVSGPQPVTAHISRIVPKTHRRQQVIIDNPVPLDVADAPAAHQKLVVLGKPGTGYRCGCGCGYNGIVVRTFDASAEEAREHLRRVQLDPEREHRLVAIASALAGGTYALPSEQDWRERLGRPDVLGLLIRDMVVAAKTAQAPRGSRRGRRPNAFIGTADVLELLPEAFTAKLPLHPGRQRRS